MKRKVLITGGCGFIGSNLVRYLIAYTDWKITILDNLSSGKKEYIQDISSDRVNFIKGDICCPDDVKTAIDHVDFVVNLAAQAGVIPSIEDPLFDMEVNIRGIILLLIHSMENKVKRVVQASSAAPLGEQAMPLDESKVPMPLSPYGASKLAAEGYCSAFAATFGLSTVALRFSNVYGPWCDNKGSVIPLFIKHIQSNKEIMIYGDGNQTRDFVYVEDICQGILLSLTKRLPSSYNLIQLGTGKETSINELYQLIEDVYNRKIQVRYLPVRKGEIYKNYTSIKKARTLLGYQPTVSLKKGLEKTIDWHTR